MMNSEIFVHAQTRIQNATATPTKSDSVPAVIRPVKRDDGKIASARLDTAESKKIPTPHVRTHQLDDYVNWLRVRVAAERAAKKQKEQGNVAEAKSQTGSIASKVSELDPSPQPIVRVDAAHAAPHSPSLPANQYKIDPDIARITAMIEKAETEYNARAASITRVEPINQAESDKRVESTIAADSMLNETIVTASGLSGETTTELVSPFDNASTNLRPTVAPLPVEPLSKVDTDEIIKTVSEAIASVLTDQSTIEIEGKIRSQLDESTNALDALPIVVAEQIRQEVEGVSGDEGNSSAANSEVSPTSQVDEIDSSSQDQAIPTSIAAWDVVDFRWPQVTNHMVTSGSEAIGGLTDSVFKLLGTEAHRLAVTGTGRGEGTTSIAISLARSAAAAGKKTLLVDADLASPGLSEQVGLGPNISWINAVNNALDPSEVIIRSQASPVCVMPMSPIVTRVTWPRFIYDLLGEVSSKVESKFDLVIFDVGPASQLIAELSRPELLIDASLIVDNGTNSADFLKTKERLEAFGISKYLVAQNTVQKISTNVA
jgi:Mrp family chromosome partitioning ATPase